jgi:MFS transporter, SP family, sugar:H+ symporter
VAAQKAGIAFVCIYIFFFASTWGPLAWWDIWICEHVGVTNVLLRVVSGELFPLKTRARSLSMTTATNVSRLGILPRSRISRFANSFCSQWLLNWAIAYSTPYLVNYGDGYANLQSKIFFVWFGACFICIAFVYFFIYETKGLTLEEVDELYDEVKVASKSRHWTPTSTFRQRHGEGAGTSQGEKPLVQSSSINGDGRTSHHEEPTHEGVWKSPEDVMLSPAQGWIVITR